MLGRGDKSLIPSLIIADGGLSSLLACWTHGVAAFEDAPTIAAAATRPGAVWMPPDDLPARARRERCTQRQAQMCGFGALHTGAALTVPPGASAGMAQTVLLQNACDQAARLGLVRVIWPISRPGMGEAALDWLADLTDRAMLVGQLASIDLPRVLSETARPLAPTGGSGGGGAGGIVRIETPYADLDDAQIMDLALDMDAPLGVAWWCQEDAPEPQRACGVCQSCLRVRAALGVVDPQGLLRAEALFASQGEVETA